MSRKLTFAEKQQRLDNSGVRLKFNNDVQINSLGDVIQYLWFNNTSLDTFRFNKKSQSFRPQITGYFRSREDCYLLSKEYLPNITFEQVSNAVDSFNSGYYIIDEPVLSKSYCPTVRRRVYNALGYNTYNKGIINSYLDKLNLNYNNVKQVQVYI